MRKYKDNNAARKITLFLFLGALLIGGIIGCASSMPIAQKPGAMLWGENCGRCHNVRTPSDYTDAQWDVAVLHMRTRANLTAVEAQRIVEFLKSSN